MNTFALFLVGVGAGWAADWLYHSLVVNKKKAEPDTDESAAGSHGHNKHEHGHEQASATEEGKSDDLSLMKGVGPKLAESMNEIGIHNYHQLSKINADELYQKLQEVGARVVNKPSLSALAEQAKLAAKGDWDGLEALQKSL